MKRKKLLDFANWLANSRRKFDMNHACDCIAGQAEHWLRPRGSRGAVDGVPETLRRAFDINPHQAEQVYAGPGFGQAGRRVAVALLRFLAATGKVDWERAERTAAAKGFKLKGAKA